MSQPLQNAHLQVKFPSVDCMCDFPLGNKIRFSDIFRTLIAKEDFIVPQNGYPVGIPLFCIFWGISPLLGTKVF